MLIIFYFINLLATLKQEGRIIIRQNLNEHLETPTQFCDLLSFYRKIGLLRGHPLSLTFKE